MPVLGMFTNPLMFVAVAASSLLQFAVVSLPWTQGFFKAVPLTMFEWGLVLGLSLAPVTIIEVLKILRGVELPRADQSFTRR
jgi:Ca2+-transporting ATPase